MSTPTNLTDCYIEELSDNWSANDQMLEAVRDLATAASDKSLKERLKESAKSIEQHTKTIRSLLDDLDENEKEHCKGMEGLVKEARKHAIDADIEDDDVRDVVIIAQYQRMCHYGIAGLGTAKAFAEALEMADHVEKLDEIVDGIYGADENMSDLAERSVNLAAKDE